MKFFVNGIWYDDRETPVIMLGDTESDIEKMDIPRSIVQDKLGNRYFATMFNQPKCLDDKWTFCDLWYRAFPEDKY